MDKFEKIIEFESKKYNVRSIKRTEGKFLEGKTDYLGNIFIPDISKLYHEEDKIYSLGVFFHEVGHIYLDHFAGSANNTCSYIEEYEATRFAIDKLKEYKLYKDCFRLFIIQYVISKIAQAYNKGHDLNAVPKEIVKWTGINIKKWQKYKKIKIIKGQEVKSRKDIVIQFTDHDGIIKQHLNL